MNTKKKPVPRVLTRGYYDLVSGITLKSDPAYRIYPKKYFEKMSTMHTIHDAINKNIDPPQEIVIVIHGLRNTDVCAAEKTRLVESRLRYIGYVHPVIGFSYDSNTKGAHLAVHAKRAMATGRKIAKKNGCNLGQFIKDFRKGQIDHNNIKKQITRIRLIGHSLGSEVIMSTVDWLANNTDTKESDILESVHLFGASIPVGTISKNVQIVAFDNLVKGKLTNYFAPTDDVLLDAVDKIHLHDITYKKETPIGLFGISMNHARPTRYNQKKVKPENHRFASYMDTLLEFP